MWFSRGNGEICISSDIKLSYHLYEKDDELVENVLVRKWCDDDWYKPSRQYLGKGELTLSDRSVIGPDNNVTHSFDYEVGQADVPVNDDIRVRSWDSDEWTSPTREYLGLC